MRVRSSSNPHPTHTNHEFNIRSNVPSPLEWKNCKFHKRRSKCRKTPAYHTITSASPYRCDPSTRICRHRFELPGSSFGFRPGGIKTEDLLPYAFMTMLQTARRGKLGRRCPRATPAIVLRKPKHIAQWMITCRKACRGYFQ